LERGHPVKNEKTFKNMISGLKLEYTKHFEKDRLPYRKNISKELIREYIGDPKDLVEFSYAPDNHVREKYEVLFDKSSKYFLKIVLSVSSEKVYIVTAHIINKTKKEKSKIIG